SPDSMNTTSSSPMSIQVPNELSRLTGSRNPGIRARLVTDSEASNTVTRSRVPAGSTSPRIPASGAGRPEYRGDVSLDILQGQPGHPPHPGGMPIDSHLEDSRCAYRDSRGLRRDDRPREGELLCVPGHQLHLVR